MNIRPFILIYLTLIFVFGLTSCSTIFTSLYGMKKFRPVDEETITHHSTKYNIPASVSYKLDTSYTYFLKSIDTTRYKEQQKNHYQPLQALYYDKTGKLKSFQINCYAGGFPNLKWGRDKIMTTFPPKQQAPLDTIISLETQLKYLQPLSEAERFSADNCDYIIIVYWSRFMVRQSKRLIHFVQENNKLATDKKVKIIYANADNIFAEK